MNRRPMNRPVAIAAAVATLASVLAAPAALAQGVDSWAQIQAMRDATPSCNANPDAPWIGRVSGNTQDAFDISRPVSFVGCFYDQATCERWKGQTSSIITTTIIQYSCKPRR